MKFRIYFPYTTGTVTHYGSGKPDSSGITPQMDLSGWPSIGNAMEFRLDLAKPSSTAFFVAGIPLTLPFPPIGTLYTSGSASVSLTTSPGKSAGQGTAKVELRIPNAPSLQGLTLGFQYLVIDQLSPLTLAHTDGVAVLLN